MSYFQEANNLYNSKNYLKALDYYEKAIKINENLSCSYYNAGVCAIKMKNYNIAIKYIEKALSYSAESKYFFNLAYSYAMISNSKKALLYFNRAWALDNNDTDCEKAIDLLLKKLPRRL
ncbi:tetratricopeptide repeat protein [Clostridium sp. 'White wine YQ']|uniref:tetratricopeptide repeat protein n=2 Tax=unclassified Clostridium TaxID=2614128 RepID=UPI0023654425|nr:tetratricopeptide repeat protein [Clostridium sp. 'White wine YQ']MDD7794028.1 tetratricopeptide repeat protein [Clostridium sp. 'White wine YQ']